MTSDQEIFVDQRQVHGSDAEIASALRDALRRSTDKVVILAGDRSVVLGEVVRVLSLSKRREPQVLPWPQTSSERTA